MIIIIAVNNELITFWLELINSIFFLLLLEPQGNDHLETLIEQGLSTRQISRITGISRGVVLKA